MKIVRPRWSCCDLFITLNANIHKTTAFTLYGLKYIKLLLACYCCFGLWILKMFWFYQLIVYQQIISPTFPTFNLQ